jgi:hypothetical protein
VTVAPTIAEPEGSVTTPLIAAVTSWPHMGTNATDIAPKIKILENIQLRTSLDFAKDFFIE